jgi:hypothetical protein
MLLNKGRCARLVAALGKADDFQFIRKTQSEQITWNNQKQLRKEQ